MGGPLVTVLPGAGASAVPPVRTRRGITENGRAWTLPVHRGLVIYCALLGSSWVPVGMKAWSSRGDACG